MLRCRNVVGSNDDDMYCTRDVFNENPMFFSLLSTSNDGCTLPLEVRGANIVTGDHGGGQKV